MMLLAYDDIYQYRAAQMGVLAAMGWWAERDLCLWQLKNRDASMDDWPGWAEYLSPPPYKRERGS